MADDSRELGRVDPKDVNAVTERFKEWITTLPEQEQLVLGWVLTRAAAAEDADVEAYAERSEGGVPVATLMAEAAGLRDVSGFALGQTAPVKVWQFNYY